MWLQPWATTYHPVRSWVTVLSVTLLVGVLVSWRRSQGTVFCLGLAPFAGLVALTVTHADVDRTHPDESRPERGLTRDRAEAVDAWNRREDRWHGVQANDDAASCTPSGPRDGVVMTLVS